MRRLCAGVMRVGLPRLFRMEGEYALQIRRCELKATIDMVEDMKKGRIPWPDQIAKTRCAQMKERRNDGR